MCDVDTARHLVGLARTQELIRQSGRNRAVPLFRPTEQSGFTVGGVTEPLTAKGKGKLFSIPEASSVPSLHLEGK